MVKLLCAGNRTEFVDCCVEERHCSSRPSVYHRPAVVEQSGLLRTFHRTFRYKLRLSGLSGDLPKRRTVAARWHAGGCRRTDLRMTESGGTRSVRAIYFATVRYLPCVAAHSVPVVEASTLSWRVAPSSVIASTCSVKAKSTASSFGHVCRNVDAGAVVLEAEDCSYLQNVFLALRTSQQRDIPCRLLLLCVESLWPSRVFLIRSARCRSLRRRRILADDVRCKSRRNCGD